MHKSNAIPLQIASNQILKLALAVCLLTLSAKLTVPFFPVPMTMQVGAVLLLAGLGGLRFGAMSVLSYLATGAAGFPIFAGTPQSGIGIAYMAGPTGGYLFGFLVAALIVGWATDRFGKNASYWAMPTGLVVIYALGLIWLAKFVPSEQLLAVGLMPFLLGDMLKVALAAVLTIWAPSKVKAWIKG